METTESAAAEAAPLPESDNTAALCLAEAVTTCCQAFVTFHDETLCCKVCWRAV